MRSRELASLLILAALPSLAQVQSRPDASPARETIAPRQHAPMRLHGYTPSGKVQSENWSGYAVTGSAFTVAKGSWTVPSVNCGKTPNTYSSFWVGIDGYSSSTVEQTGTDSDCSGSSARYYAWYEFYPAGSILISSVGVSPGNKMSASVTYSGSQFTVKITNVTTGKSFSKSGRVSGSAADVGGMDCRSAVLYAERRDPAAGRFWDGLPGQRLHESERDERRDRWRDLGTDQTVWKQRVLDHHGEQQWGDRGGAIVADQGRDEL